jgi:hypothetical protein
VSKVTSATTGGAGLLVNWIVETIGPSASAAILALFLSRRIKNQLNAMPMIGAF